MNYRLPPELTRFITQTSAPDEPEQVKVDYTRLGWALVAGGWMIVGGIVLTLSWKYLTVEHFSSLFH